VPEIRSRTEADLDRCVTFLRTVHDKAGYPINWPADPRDWLSPPDTLGCWVITTDDRVVGHVAITRGEPGQALVERLFVDPAETGAGLGRRLLDHCLTIADQLGRCGRLGCDRVRAARPLTGWALGI
jgi:GNAT superfamily N-acetyltransferase